jgi:hypothetical protein
MVHKTYMHQLAGSLDTTCKFIVGPAGSEASRGVVMAYCHDGSITQHCLAYDDADIDSSLADATTGDTYLLDKAVVLVEI